MRYVFYLDVNDMFPVSATDSREEGLEWLRHRVAEDAEADSFCGFDSVLVDTEERTTTGMDMEEGRLSEGAYSEEELAAMRVWGEE